MRRYFCYVMHKVDFLPLVYSSDEPLSTDEWGFWCKHHHHCNILRIEKRFCTKGNSQFTVFACRWTWDLRYVNFVLLLCQRWLVVIWGIDTLLCVGIVGVDGIWRCAVLCVVAWLRASEEQPHCYCYCHLWISGSTHISTPSPHLVFSPLVMSFDSREVKILMGPTPIFGFDAITCFKSRSSALLFHHI